MRTLATSASGVNGAGFGTVLDLDLNDGRPARRFTSDERVTDPRGIGLDPATGAVLLNCADRILALDLDGTVIADTGALPGLDPGGGVIGPDGRWYLGSRRRSTVLALPVDLSALPEQVLPDHVVPFPRGFGFNTSGELLLASGIGPDGRGDNEVIALDADGRRLPWRTSDEGLSPLDLLVPPDGDPLVVSEHPFGAPDATTTVRQYDQRDGHLIRVLTPSGSSPMRRPRGLHLADDGRLLVIAQDEITAFDLDSGGQLESPVRLPRLNGQALLLL